MKRSVNAVGMLLAAVGLLSTVGCDHIRDYSVSSYQGPLPMGDSRTSSGSVPPKPPVDAVIAAQPSAVPLNPAPTPSSVPAGSAPILDPSAPAAGSNALP